MKVRLLTSLARVFVVGSLGVLMPSDFRSLTPSAAWAQSAPAAAAQTLSLAFEQAAEAITPSIVTINSTKKTKITKEQRKQLEPFKDFFGEDLFDRFMPFDQIPQQGMGTGVIVDGEGHILTNNHVVGDADEVRVKLQNGKTFKAKVVGSDSRSDLAVIKISERSIPAAKLGDSDGLKIGEWVVAAGNPFGLDNSITAGIVSAKGRSLMGGGQYEDFIQTDAAINPGNSGGPLVNLNGEVVGINTAIFSRSGGYMGIGFAIPINMARNVMKSLITEGRVVRGWLGVGIQNLSEDLAQSFEYAGTEGALVGHVEKSGPAAKAGLKQGDIIVSINGQKVTNVNQLRNIVASLPPGKSVELSAIRNGRKIASNVEIGELPSQEATAEEAEEDSGLDIGVALEPLSPEIRRRLKTERSEGVVVSSVRPEGLAAKAGVQPGDVIVSLGGEEVSSISQFRQLLRKQDLKNGARMVVESQGMERFVFLKSED
jgi:serine protease Do